MGEIIVYQALYGPEGLVIFDHPYNTESVLAPRRIGALLLDADYPVQVPAAEGIGGGHLGARALDRRGRGR